MGWRGYFSIAIVSVALLANRLPAQQATQQRTRPATATAPATPPPTKVAPDTMAFPLQTLKVIGNERIPAERVIAASGLRIGEPVLKTDFDAARERLLATGAFESVGCAYRPSADNHGYDGQIQVAEIVDVYPYRFEELPGADDKLRALLREKEPIFDDQIPATTEVLARYEREINQALGTGPAVKGKLMSDLPGKLMIVFRPPVSRSNIAEVRFTGSQIVPEGILNRTMADIAIGLPFSEPNVRALLDSTIRPLYDARGRIRVTFPTVVAEKSTAQDVEGMVVTISVNEGPPYSLGTIRFAGVAQTQVKELEKTADWKHDDVVNFDNIKEGVERIQRRLRRAGYMKVAAQVDREVHDDTHKVDLTVSITPGPQYMFGKLTIIGLDLISEPPIRKMWGEREGKPFDPEAPDTFLKQIHDQELFENLGKTRSETKVDDATRTVAVTLYFPAAPPPAPKPKQGLGGVPMN